MTQPERIPVENVNVPGQITNVRRDRYQAMKDAMLRVLPKLAPGLSQKEMLEALIPVLPEDQFPGGEKAAWWMKTVQLDLEAKGLLVRESSKPLRWHLANRE